MARYVLDANVVVTVVALEDGPIGQVDEFWADLTAQDELFGPQVLIPECATALRTKVYDKLISEETALRWLELILRLPITVIDDSRQFARALELAGQSRRRKTYDMQYLATAQITASTMVTLDSGIRQRALELKHPMRYLR